MHHYHTHRSSRPVHTRETLPTRRKSAGQNSNLDHLCIILFSLSPDVSEVGHISHYCEY